MHGKKSDKFVGARQNRHIVHPKRCKASGPSPGSSSVIVSSGDRTEVACCAVSSGIGDAPLTGLVIMLNGDLDLNAGPVETFCGMSRSWVREAAAGGDMKQVQRRGTTGVGRRWREPLVAFLSPVGNRIGGVKAGGVDPDRRRRRYAPRGPALARVSMRRALRGEEEYT